MFLIREGWDGLVRGNEGEARSAEPRESSDFLDTYGEGEFLKEGEAEHELKGKHILRVGWDDVRGFASEGGTVIGTARSAAFRELEGRRRAAPNLIKNGIDAVICCGGDGSLTGADKLRAEWPDHLAALVKDGAYLAPRPATYPSVPHRSHHTGASGCESVAQHCWGAPRLSCSQ
jgi:6-phosphofructokinase 1